MAAQLGELDAADIPDELLFDHFRLNPEYEEPASLDFARACRAAAYDHVREAYGIDEQTMSAHPSIAIAVLAVARDMFDNRDMEGHARSNRTVEAVMSSFDFNLI